MISVKQLSDILFYCKFCNKDFKHKSGLKKHEARHEPPGGFLCKYCEARFCWDKELTKHKENSHKVYICGLCKDTFIDNEHYLNHIISVHDGRDREYIVCENCGHQFKSHTNLRSHMESKCGTIKPFECNICKLRYMTQATLNVHKRIHFDEKQHCCSFCGKNFLSKGQLTVHERQHTGDKPYKCDVCPKEFCYRESLVTHSSIHTGIKPYECEYCGNRFSCVGNLQKHRRTRPNTCGQFDVNKKAAPRPSSKVPGSLTMKQTKIRKTNKVIKPDIKIKKRHNQRILGTNNENKLEELNINNYIIDNCKYEEYFSNDLDISSEIEAVENLETAENVEPEIIYEIITEKEDDQNEDIKFETLDTVNEYDETINNEYKEIINDQSDEENKNIGFKIENFNNVDSNIYKGCFSMLQPKEEIFIEVENIILEDTSIKDDLNSLGYQSSVIEYDENSKEETDFSKKCENVSENDKEQLLTDALKNIPKEIEQILDRIYKCCSCPKIYKQKKAYLKHLKNDHKILLNIAETIISQLDEKEPFKCKDCDQMFSSKNSFRNHLKQHSKVVCGICMKIFDNQNSLNEHKITIHQKTKNKNSNFNKNFACSKCDKKFITKIAYVDHERSSCGLSPLYKCNICNKYYHSLSSLKTHQTIHTGDLPHVCNHCNKAFRTPGQVKVHMRQHNGEKPFKCEICPKRFAYRESLVTHVSVHTGLKRFTCQNCNLRFSCISNLQSHRKIKKDTCGSVPKMTKPTGKIIGVSGGTVFIKNNPKQNV